MPTVNEKITDWLLRNQHYLQRVENGAVQDVAQYYHKAKPIIKLALEETERYGTGFTRDFRIARLNNILDEVNMTLDVAAMEATGELQDILTNVAGAQADGLYNNMLRSMGPVGTTLNRLPTADLLHIVEQPMLGQVFGDRMLWNNADAVRNMRSTLATSVILGEDMARATQYVIGSGQLLGGEVGDKIIDRSKIIARTEIQRVSNAVNEATFDANQDVIKGVQAIATLDRRTCVICGGLDGNEYYYDPKYKPKVPRKKVE